MWGTADSTCGVGGLPEQDERLPVQCPSRLAAAHFPSPPPTRPTRRDVRPSVTTYNCLITAASDSGCYATLAEVGRWLQGADPDIKAACMNAYVSGLVKVRRGRKEVW